MTRTCVRVDHLESTEELLTLTNEWNILLESSSSNSIFLTWEWIFTWWSTYGKNAKLLVLVARDDGNQLVGLAPLMIVRGKKVWNRHVKYLHFIGQQSDTLAEYLDFIVRRGYESMVIAAFVSYLNDRNRFRWDVIDLELTLEDSKGIAVFEQSLEGQLIKVTRTNQQISPFLNLPASWDSFLASKSSNFRNQWRSAWKRIETAGSLRILRAGHDLPVSDAIDHLIRLNRMRWGDRGGSFRSTAYITFHRLLSERFHQTGKLIFLLLEINGRVIAARYDFLSDRKIWCFQGGWDPAFESCRLGTIMTGLVIQWGIQNEYEEYDFLTGSASYKDRWSSKARRTVSILAYRNTWNGQITRKLDRLRFRVRQLLWRNE